MIPKKIKIKVKEVCGDDIEAYNTIMKLLEYEDSGKGKQVQNCKKVVEEYTKKVTENEN